MYYPWWYIPYLTAPMLIAVVAVIHVIVAHYAVGGGILLALENRYARKTGDEKYRAYWKKHAHFFILLTVAFGAITGVGIWWTIGLASPVATEMLIRTFVFGWGIEWCFFIMEVVAAFAFYYYWDKMKARSHVLVGWIYALSAWISLVLITAITAYMLNSRSLLTGGTETPGLVDDFWQSFLNVQFIPQTVVRTGGALILATFYVYLHVTWTEQDGKVREKVVRRMRVPSITGLVLLVAGLVGWLFFLPPHSLMMMERAAALNLFLGLFLAILGAVVVLIYVGPVRSPQTMSFGLALALFFFGVAAVAVGEFVREAVRKPFIVDRFIYGNQIYTNDVPVLQNKGYLACGTWTGLYLQKLQEKYPNLQLITPITTDMSPLPSTKSEQPILTSMTQKEWHHPSIQQTQLTVNSNGDQTPSFTPLAVTSTSSVPSPLPSPLPESETAAATSSLTVQVPRQPIAPVLSVHYSELLKVSDEDRKELGRLIFMYHCNDCHADGHGYSAAAPLLTGKSREEIQRMLEHLNRPGFFMPPWCGNSTEAELLADYLSTIRPEMPANMK